MADWRTNGGVYFGYGSDKTLNPPPLLDPYRLIRYVGDRHLISVGPNGSGKSRRLLLPNLADLTGWSILVVDPKGELQLMTAKHREDHGSRIVRLNPFDAFGLGSDGFNPISALDPRSEDFPDDAMGMAEALIRVEGKEPYFSQSAQDLVCALIMYVRITLPDPSLFDVRALLGQKLADFKRMVSGRSIAFRKKTIPGMIEASKLYDCPELDAKVSRFADIGTESRELLSVISTALTQTRWLDSRPVKKDLARDGPAFDFSIMKEEPTTVYLVLPARRLGTHSTWLRLMITSVLQPLLKDTRSSRVPILLMLDEFAQLGHLPVIENTIGLMRGYGIKMWAVFQDFAQANAIYGDRWQSFVGNAGVMQAFAPQDVVTAKEFSEACGQTTATPFSASGGGAGMSFSQTEVPVPSVLPQDLRNMDDGFSMILSHKSKGPIPTYIPYPTELPHMRNICALDPASQPPTSPIRLR